MLRFCLLSILFLPAILFADITGTVTDPQGMPVAGARVHLLGSAIAREAVTGADGAFQLPAPPDGEYTLLATAPGLSMAPQRVHVSGGAARADLRLELAARRDVVVVTAERAEIPASAAGSSTTVITREQLDEMHVENVGDALRRVPGLHVVQTGRRGAVTGLFARGGESDFNLVMIDGVKVNEFGGAFNFAHLPVEVVDRIEVVRGPQSAVYGLNAIGSVVHILTRRPAGRFQAYGEAEGGSFRTARGSLGAAGREGRFGWGVDLVHHSTEGVVPNDDYRNAAGMLHLQYDFSASTRLRYNLLADANEYGAPGPYRMQPIDLAQRGKQNAYMNGIEFETQRGRVRQKFNAGFYSDRIGFESAFGPSRTRQFRGGFVAETQVAVAESDVLAFGFEFQRERFRNSFVTNATNDWFPLRRNNLGWFVENRWQRGGRLFVNAGARVENIRTSSLPADAWGSRPLLEARSITEVSPKISVAFLPRLDGRTRLHASAGTGLRAPDGFELAFTNNNALDPERTRSFDAGIEQEFAGRKAVLGATYFFNRYRDLIVTVSGDLRSLTRFQSDNLSNARAQGVEFSGAWRPLPWLGFNGHYTWLKSEVLSLSGAPGRAPLPFRVGDRLVRRPPHSAAYSATWNIPQLRLTLNTGAVMRSEISDVDPVRGFAGGILRNPGYVRPDVGAEFALTREVALYGRLYNFSDSRYEEALGFPALGRNFVAGVKLRFH